MSNPGSNGGIWIMTDYQDRVWPAKGFEIQVNNSHRDPIRTGSLYHVQDVMNDSPAKDDVWCTLDILAQGDTIVVRVDDKEIGTLDAAARLERHEGLPPPAGRPGHHRVPGPRPQQRRLLQEHPNQAAGLRGHLESRGVNAAGG